MNEHDLKNVYFLLNADTETLAEWYAMTTDDDHEYACEIMKAYQAELNVKLELIRLSEFQTQDTQLANSILDRYRL